MIRLDMWRLTDTSSKKITNGEICIPYIASRNQLMNTLTKGCQAPSFSQRAGNGKHFLDGLRGIIETWHINFLSKEIAFPVILHLALDSSDLIYPRIIRLNV